LQATDTRLAETSDTIGLFLEIPIISCSEHVDIRNSLDPFEYLLSGHVTNILHPTIRYGSCNLVRDVCDDPEGKEVSSSESGMTSFCLRGGVN
jgi:hypothetical protein